jgi:predicted DNA-binding transcriptional regulator AlpA
MSKSAPVVSLENSSIFHDDALFRLEDLEELRITPFSRATLWRRVRDGVFPRPIRISENIVAWRWRDLRCWLSDPAIYRANEKVAGNGGLPQ